MDTDDQPIKDACANLLQDGVRQARYRLKRKYFDDVAANEVMTTSPVNHITNEQWRELVRKWSDPKNKVRTRNHIMSLVSSSEFVLQK